MLFINKKKRKAYIKLKELVEKNRPILPNELLFALDDCEEVFGKYETPIYFIAKCLGMKIVYLQSDNYTKAYMDRNYVYLYSKKDDLMNKHYIAYFIYYKLKGISEIRVPFSKSTVFTSVPNYFALELILPKREFVKMFKRFSNSSKSSYIDEVLYNIANKFNVSTYAVEQQFIQLRKENKLVVPDKFLLKE